VLTPRAAMLPCQVSRRGRPRTCPDIGMDQPSKLSRRRDKKRCASRPNYQAPKARSGTALAAKPDKVEEVVRSTRRTFWRESESQKEGVDEIGSDTPSLGVNWRTMTARVVYGYEITLAQVLVGRSMGPRTEYGRR